MVDIHVIRSTVEGEDTDDYEIEELVYSDDIVPMIGDRIVYEKLGMRVLERTWYVDRFKTNVWVELRVEAE